MQLRALFVEKTDNPFLQLFRYVFVGGIAAVFDFGTLYLLDEFCRIHHLLAAAVAFLVGVTVNYLISKQFVFTQKKASPVAEFLEYAVIGVIGLGLTEGIVYLCTVILGFYVMLSKLVATVLVFFWNFFARRIFLYRSKENE